MQEMKKLLIGTSGWSYDHWRGKFYPARLAQKNWLDFYASAFDTVEINASFYRLPTVTTFAGWREHTPAGFVFAVKASRYLTHVKKLNDPQEPWQRFYDNAKELRRKLGPILFQFPANWRANPLRLESFLDVLPQDVRAAFEFRHQSWFEPEIYTLLREHGAGLCQADSPQWPATDVVTAGFVFVRMHGGRSLYGSRYTRAELRKLASRLRDCIAAGLDVYVYFNNDAEANAVANAVELREMLGDA